MPQPLLPNAAGLTNHDQPLTESAGLITVARMANNNITRSAYISLLLLALLVVGCQADAMPLAGAVVAEEGAQQVDGGETAVAQPTLTSLTVTNPPIITTATPAADMPAFSLSPEVTPSPPATATPAATTSNHNSKTAAPTATASPTPPPTFTPPALPYTSPNEHYWLRRPVPEGDTVWTDKAYPYGSTRNGQLRPHHGVEFNVTRGTEILAAASGTVIVAGDDAAVAYGPTTDFYGNLIVIELDSRYNGQPVYTLYGHLSSIMVAQGQHVDAQDVIALSGATGVADGPHMHFEVRVGQNDYDSTRNPLLWLYPFPDSGAVAGRVTWPDGTLVREAPVRAHRIDAPSRYAATTTYAGNTVNPDPGWDENFVIDDLEAGYYEVVVAQGEDKYKEEVWVYPYQTSFVEIVLDTPVTSGSAPAP